MYTGLSLSFPLKKANSLKIQECLKWFMGVGWTRKPKTIVKSDCAGNLMHAIKALGFNPDPSLADHWPHNTAHERSHVTTKSVQRASILQAGTPASSWDICIWYASVALNITQKAPLMPHEKDANGQPLEAFVEKSNMSAELEQFQAQVNHEYRMLSDIIGDHVTDDGDR